MHDLPRQTLQALIAHHGRALCDDPRRCAALLRDLCATHKREIFVLMSALRHRVAEELSRLPAGVPPALALARLTQRLEDELALTREAARWAVESWALALAVIDRPLAEDASAPTGAGLDIRYDDHWDGTLTDVQTGLRWMRCALGQVWRDGGCAGEASRHAWPELARMVRTFNQGGGYAGLRDWRLPAKNELLTLVRCSNGQPGLWKPTEEPCHGSYARPTICPAAFPNTPASFFWSGSPYAYRVHYAWYVYFKHGNASFNSQGHEFHARLMRGGA